MSRKSHKRELFRVAFKMFILKSFDGVSIPDIEKATGFTRGTIFHYADTKLDLFRQVVEYYVLERQDIERKIQVADDCTLRQFIDTYAKGVERTMEALHEIIGMDVPMRDCSRAYLNMTSQVSVLLPEVLAKIMMSLFYGRAFQDSLIDGMDPKLLKEEMLAVYERVKKR